jgi:hypothetical protein
MFIVGLALIAAATIPGVLDPQASIPAIVDPTPQTCVPMNNGLEEICVEPDDGYWTLVYWYNEGFDYGRLDLP